MLQSTPNPILPQPILTNTLPLPNIPILLPPILHIRLQPQPQVIRSILRIPAQAPNYTPMNQSLFRERPSQSMGVPAGHDDRPIRLNSGAFER